MRTNLILNRKTYLQFLLITPAIALLGIASCAMAQGRVRPSHTNSYLHIGGSSYNSESHGFDRPWPFGPESTQQ